MGRLMVVLTTGTLLLMLHSAAGRVSSFGQFGGRFGGGYGISGPGSVGGFGYGMGRSFAGGGGFGAGGGDSGAGSSGVRYGQGASGYGPGYRAPDIGSFGGGHAGGGHGGGGHGGGSHGFGGHGAGGTGGGHGGGGHSGSFGGLYASKSLFMQV